MVHGNFSDFVGRWIVVNIGVKHRAHMEFKIIGYLAFYMLFAVS